jgi:hypothetical protein
MGSITFPRSLRLEICPRRTLALSRHAYSQPLLRIKKAIALTPGPFALVILQVLYHFPPELFSAMTAGHWSFNALITASHAEKIRPRAAVFYSFLPKNIL